MDAGDFAPCSSPHTTPALSDGQHSFAVRAGDQAGNVDQSPASRSFTIAAQGPGDRPGGGPGDPGGVFGPDTTDPILSRLRLGPARFLAAPAATSAATSRGTRIAYRLSEPGAVRFWVQRAARGRRVGNRCVAPRRSNRTRPGCRRYLTLRGSFADFGQRGENSLRFSGRLGGRRLSPGLHRLIAIPRDGAGNLGRVSAAGFRVLSARRVRPPRFTG